MILNLILAAAASMAAGALTPAAQSRVEALARPQEAVALLECVMQRDGGLTGCRVTAEAPSDLGVGEAALAMSAQYRLDPLGPDGRLRTGEVVEVPVRIRINR